MTQHLGDTLSPRRRLAIIITLGLLTGMGPFTIDMYLPSFPSLKADLGINDQQVQVTLSATVVGFALGQLVIGPLSDRVGRRVPLLLMNCLHVGASVAAALSVNVEMLTGMRALQGIGAAGGAVVAMAMARDLFSGRRLITMMSRLALINGLAPIVAPIVGSWFVTVTDWRGVFWVLALYGAVVVALNLLFIIETRPPAERTGGGFAPLLASYRRVLGDRLFVGVWLVGAFAFGGLFSYVSSSSVLLQEVFGLSPRGFGTIFAICSVGVFIGVQLGARLGPRLGSLRVLIIGTSVMVATSLALIGLHEVYSGYVLLVPLIFCYTTGFGSVMPNSQVLAMQNHRADSGVAASLMGAANMGLAAFMGPIINHVQMTSVVPMATAMLVCALVSAAALWAVVVPARGGIVLE